MTPAAILLIAEILLKYGPSVARQFQALFTKNTPPTQHEWDAIFAMAEKSYEDYVKPIAPPPV